MLRERVPKKAIHLKEHEWRRLYQLGQAIGPELKHLITIVTFDTFRSWRRKIAGFVPRGTPGRPRKPDEIRQLVLKIARETGWGYTRILGELKKLGIENISRQTVKNYLKQAGFDPDPKTGPGTWDELLKAHAETLWQCDFFSKRVLSRFGIPQLFVMVFLNVATRRVWVSPATKNPTEKWVEEQAQAFLDFTAKENLPVELVSRDNDQIYKKGFDRVMREAGVKPKRIALRSPNLNAYVERFIQTIQVECLDHFLVFGVKHFNFLVREFVRYYHECRPHQGLGNRVIGAKEDDEPAAVLKLDEVKCESRLGGLLKHYYREAA